MKKWQIGTLAILLCLVMVFAGACSGGTSGGAAASGGTPTETTSGETEDTTSAGSSDMPDVTWKLAHVVSEQNATHLFILKWVEALSEATDGHFKVNVYPNGALGNNRELLEQQQMGTLELGVTNVALLSGYYQPMAICELPYLIKSQDKIASVFDSTVFQRCRDGIEPAGLKWAASWMQGWRNLTTSNTPVHTPADVKGLKIRTQDSQLHIDHFNAIGACAVPMAFSEVFTALQQGAIDGQENPYCNIYTQGYYEVQKYIIETKHICDITPFIISLKSYEALPANYQKIMTDLASGMAEEERTFCMSEEDKFKQMIIDKGTTEIIELTPEERQQFLEAAQPVYEKWQDKIGKEFIDSVFAAQE